MSMTERMMDIIKRAGEGGISAPDLSEALGIDARKVGYMVKQQSDRKKLDRLRPPASRPQLFAIAKPVEPKAPNMPPKSDSITVINKAQPRNFTLSTERQKIEALLDMADVGLRVAQISSKTGVPVKRARTLLWRMARDGQATNTGTAKEALWRSKKKSNAASDAALEKSKSYHCAGTMPRARVGDIPRMECVR